MTMDARQFVNHLATWSQDRTFGCIEEILTGIEAEAKKHVSEGCIARFASVSDSGNGHCFVVGDGVPFCYIRVFTQGKKKLTITKIQQSKHN